MLRLSLWWRHRFTCWKGTVEHKPPAPFRASYGSNIWKKRQTLWRTIIIIIIIIIIIECFSTLMISKKLNTYCRRYTQVNIQAKQDTYWCMNLHLFHSYFSETDWGKLWWLNIGCRLNPKSARLSSTINVSQIRITTRVDSTGKLLFAY